MNNNLFSNKKIIKKIGLAIIAIFVIMTALYNLKLQSVTRYKAQQQSMVDEYNLNSEQQSGNAETDSEITENGSEEVSNDSISSQSDTSIFESTENPTPDNSSNEKTGNDNALNYSTLSAPADNNAVVSQTNGSLIIVQENSTASSELEDATCYIEIRCDTISNNMSKWTNNNKNKISIVPTNGVIMGKMKINVTSKSTVFDVLKMASSINNISIEANAGYVKSIKQLEQLDAGRGSGWLYWVNNVSPNIVCSSYTVKNGDIIKWQYTCDYGNEFDGNGNLK